MSNEYLVFSQLKIHTEQKILQDACLVVRDKTIHALIDHEDVKNYPSAKIFTFPSNYHLIPGFIDLHVHGANGSDFMDATPNAFQTICDALAKEGTTSFLATTMTSSLEKITETIRALKQFSSTVGAKMLGIHLEGPFLSTKKAGAQCADHILNPNSKYIEDWQTISNGLIKLVTLAPELPDAIEFIKYLKTKNIIAAIGHTNANYSETVNAIAAGCTHATHLFNAMSGLHHREPGAALAILLSDQIMAELIIDGVHLHPAIVQLAIKMKGTDKLTLVTDAMRAKCLCDGEYDLGGQTVFVKHNQAVLQDGTLAGSVLKMNSAVQNLLQLSACSLSDAIQMACVNPAKSLGIFTHKGSIALHKDADLVVLDEQLNVVLTLCEGQIAFMKEEILVME